MAVIEDVGNDLQLLVRSWLLEVLRQIRLNKQLLSAIEEDDAAAVCACLVESADPNTYAVPRYRAPALLRAITQYYDPENPPDDRWDLWEDDLCPSDEPHFGRTPGNTDIIEALLHTGADINKRDKCDKSALEAAVQFCDRSVVHLLLARDADVNSRLPYRATVLQIAVLHRDVDIDDQTAIKVVDGTVEVVSDGHWKLFTR